jgi:hypothetical protein
MLQRRHWLDSRCPSTRDPAGYGGDGTDQERDRSEGDQIEARDPDKHLTERSGCHERERQTDHSTYSNQI